MSSSTLWLASNIVGAGGIANGDSDVVGSQSLGVSSAIERKDGSTESSLAFLNGAGHGHPLWDWLHNVGLFRSEVEGVNDLAKGSLITSAWGDTVGNGDIVNRLDVVCSVDVSIESITRLDSSRDGNASDYGIREADGGKGGGDGGEMHDD